MPIHFCNDLPLKACKPVSSGELPNDVNAAAASVKVYALKSGASAPQAAAVRTAAPNQAWSARYRPIQEKRCLSDLRLHHNAGRTQMAAAFFNYFADPTKAEAISAGTKPGLRVHPEVLAVMQEIGIDLRGVKPWKLTEELAREAQLLITMGCGDKSNEEALRSGGFFPVWGEVSWLSSARRVRRLVPEQIVYWCSACAR